MFPLVFYTTPLVTHMHTCQQIDEYSLVSFTPLDITDEESISNVLMMVDMSIQYGEDTDIHIPKVNHV